MTTTDNASQPKPQRNIIKQIPHSKPTPLVSFNPSKLTSRPSLEGSKYSITTSKLRDEKAIMRHDTIDVQQADFLPGLYRIKSKDVRPC
ncbi:hypothetical protein CEXT_132181 [Caerostris extrusa]|uniref:Uncharacterized protein n=1 Tax=Caerostris extrusa TaxID=172846 RepID=A0AAV4Y564_CAEEX|nr:hypothetical protein CEXT_132181 [Caerostris extrusa]